MPDDCVVVVVILSARSMGLAAHPRGSPPLPGLPPHEVEGDNDGSGQREDGEGEGDRRK